MNSEGMRTRTRPETLIGRCLH